MAKRKANKNNEVKGINFNMMVRDVLRAAINKGQGIPILIGLIILMGIMKMPGKAVGDLAFRIFDAIIDFSLVGWILGITTATGWYIHAKWQRREIFREMKRLSDQRTELQQRLLGSDIESSDDM